MDKTFGSKVRTDVLVAVGRLGTTYVSELAKVLKRRPIEIQRAVASLELADLVQTRRMGTLRIVELNRRYREYDDLSALLLRMSERPIYSRQWREYRRRPRAVGKSI